MIGRVRRIGLALNLCTADGSTHTESNELYRRVKHRARPNLSSRQRPLFFLSFSQLRTELQMIGRVHRIGQSRQTHVHRLAIRGSGEETVAQRRAAGE